jgi:hypothetical protein
LALPYASIMVTAAAPSCVCTIFSTLPPVALTVSTTSSTAEEGALSRYSLSSLAGGVGG